MAQTGIFIPLDPVTQQRLQTLADAQHQPIAEVAAGMLSRVVDLESWELQQIQLGIDQLAAGKGISHERAVAWMNSLGTDHELPMPQ